MKHGTVLPTKGGTVQQSIRLHAHGDGNADDIAKERQIRQFAVKASEWEAVC